MVLGLKRNRTNYPCCQTPFYEQIQRDGLSNRQPQYLRPMVNLKPYMTAVENQGEFNSCVAESVAGALEYLIKRYHGLDSNGKEFDVSRMFIIWVGNMIEKESLEDQNNEGAWAPEAIYGVVKYGFCDERLWSPSVYTRKKKPPKSVFETARKLTIVPLLIPPNLDSMRRCLNYDLPFLIGIEVALFGMPDMRRINNNYNQAGPIPQEVGRHAVLVVGYDDRTQLFLVRNSWGSNWGVDGYFYIPYKYMVDRRFMGHDEVGIWAIPAIIPRKKNRLLRFHNPPSDPNNQFLTLDTDTQIDVWYWDVRRFAINGIKSGQLNEHDIHNSTILWEKYRNYLAINYPQKLRHLEKDD